MAKCYLMMLHDLKTGEIHYATYSEGPGSVTLPLRVVRAVVAETEGVDYQEALDKMALTIKDLDSFHQRGFVELIEDVIEHHDWEEILPQKKTVVDSLIADAAALYCQSNHCGECSACRLRVRANEYLDEIQTETNRPAAPVKVE